MKTPKGYVGLMQAAEVAWPEDEAHGTFETLRDSAYQVECFERDVAHMRKVFGRESDAESLIVRYDARLAALLKSNELTATVCLPSSPFPALPLS